MPTPSHRPLTARPTLRRLVGGLVAIALLAGCAATEDEPTGARVLVTTDQGSRSLLDKDGIKVSEGDRVLDVVSEVAEVTLDDDGDTVTAIDGTAASGDQAWTFWVNGVEIRGGPIPAADERGDVLQQADVATVRAAEVADGDTIWLDLRSDPDVGQPRGVVGTFPEPFLHGYGARRWPVRVECVDPRSDGCHEVRDVLVDYGIPAVVARLRSMESAHTARVSVGLWKDIRVDPAMRLAEDGVAVSGIYAVPQSDGRAIDLLDVSGRKVDTAGPGTGLIFASRFRDEAPSWAVTGTDEAGVAAAIEAWNSDVLHRNYAVVVRDGAITPLPVAR